MNNAFASGGGLNSGPFGLMFVLNALPTAPPRANFELNGKKNFRNTIRND